MTTTTTMSESVDWMQRLRANIADMVPSANYGRYAKNLTAIEASERRAIVEFVVNDDLMNGKGTLHGGQTALLVDICTALAITLTLRDTPIVSVEIGCRYLAPAICGDRVRVVAECVKIGRNIVFAEATFRKADCGTIIAKGTHTLARLNHLRTADGSFVRQ